MLQRIGKSCAVKTNVTKRLTEAEDRSFSVGKSMRRDIGDIVVFESDKDIKSQSRAHGALGDATWLWLPFRWCPVTAAFHCGGNGHHKSSSFDNFYT